MLPSPDWRDWAGDGVDVEGQMCRSGHVIARPLDRAGLKGHVDLDDRLTRETRPEGVVGGRVEKRHPKPAVSRDRGADDDRLAVDTGRRLVLPVVDDRRAADHAVPGVPGVV